MTLSHLARALLILLALPAFGVQPDEILDDPALEARARAISEDIRCPICAGESIDESHAPISRELRLLVRERLLAGDTDAETIAYVVERYGQQVLFLPRFGAVNLMLWLAGPLVLLAGIAMAVRLYRQPAAEGPKPLTADEEARLKDLMGD